MASIATATLAYSDLTLWLGIGLWGLFILGASGTLLSALTGHTAAALRDSLSSRVPRSS